MTLIWSCLIVYSDQTAPQTTTFEIDSIYVKFEEQAIHVSRFNTRLRTDKYSDIDS